MITRNHPARKPKTIQICQVLLSGESHLVRTNYCTRDETAFCDGYLFWLSGELVALFYAACVIGIITNPIL
jgi:hypothetical protein